MLPSSGSLTTVCLSLGVETAASYPIHVDSAVVVDVERIREDERSEVEAGDVLDASICMCAISGCATGRALSGGWLQVPITDTDHSDFAPAAGIGESSMLRKVLSTPAAMWLPAVL